MIDLSKVAAITDVAWGPFGAQWGPFGAQGPWHSAKKVHQNGPF